MREDVLNKLKEMKLNTETIKLDSEKMSDFIAGYRVRVAPLDMPKGMTTTEILLEIITTLNTLLEDYENFDGDTKQQINDFLEEYNKYLSDLNNDITNDMTENENRITSCETITNNFSKRLSDYDKTVQQLTNRLDNLVLNDSDKVDDELKANIKTCISNYNDLKFNVDMKIGTMTSNYNELSKKIASLQTSNASNEGNIKGILRSMEELASSDTRLEKKMNNIVDKNDELNEKISNYNFDSLENLRKSVDEIGVVADETKSTTARLNATAQSLQAHQTELENNLDRWKEQVQLNANNTTALQTITSDLRSKTTQNEQNIALWQRQININKKTLTNIETLEESFVGIFRFEPSAKAYTCYLKNNTANFDDEYKADTYKYTVPYGTDKVHLVRMTPLSNVLMSETGGLKMSAYNLSGNSSDNHFDLFKLKSGYHSIDIKCVDTTTSPYRAKQKEEIGSTIHIVRFNINDSFLDYINSNRLTKTDLEQITVDLNETNLTYFSEKPKVACAIDNVSEFMTDNVTILANNTTTKNGILTAGFYIPHEDNNKNIFYGICVVNEPDLGNCYYDLAIDTKLGVAL